MPGRIRCGEPLRRRWNVVGAGRWFMAVSVMRSIWAGRDLDKADEAERTGDGDMAQDDTAQELKPAFSSGASFSSERRAGDGALGMSRRVKAP